MIIMSNLERAIEQSVQSWPVVGLSCALLEFDGRAVARGFGVKRIGTQERVDQHTLFAIGSVSKSFTGAAIAMLVDDGAIAWESRVIDHLPGFRLFDPFVTREMTVRDLLTHRSGLERGDFMWYKSGYSSAEVMRRVRFLEPTWGFRTAFGYQNIMYLAAGELITALTGKSWDDFIKERIFDPLHMNESHPSFATVEPDGNVAAAHAKLDGKLEQIRPHDDYNVNSAGSIYSNAVDMLAWLQFALDGGAFEGRRLLTTSSSETTQTLHMPIARSAWSELFPEADFLGYGAGWFVWSYRGRKVVSHGGNIDGMSAMACVVPEERFGISILVNVDGSRLPQALLYHALDEVLESPRRTWLADFREMERVGEERLTFARNDRARLRVPDTHPSRPLAAYAGVYTDDFYGSAMVTAENEKLSMKFIGFDGELSHWHLDTFALHLEDLYLAKYQPIVRFDLDDYGEPCQLTLSVVGGVRMTLQRKLTVPKPVEVSEDEIRDIEGTFESAAPPIRIVIERFATLKATVPGTIAGVSDDTTEMNLMPIGLHRFILGTSPAILRLERTDDRDDILWLEVPHQMPLRLTRTPLSSRACRGKRQ
jgi:CubicO group peptidase (beta-lactamase class C family)